MERLIFRYILRFYEWEVMIYGNINEIHMLLEIDNKGHFNNNYTVNFMQVKSSEISEVRKMLVDEDLA